MPSQQCPFDLWVYQELIQETRPDSIIEVGIKRGGTTLYFAHLLDALYQRSGAEVVVGVDIAVRVGDAVSAHPRVRLVEGSSIDPKTVARVRELAGTRPLLLLDSNHTAEHVERELDLYADLVPSGGYLIVNDTNINGHPVLVGKGAGPYEAVESFLERRPDFESDRWREKHMLTQSPNGFLRRSDAPSSHDRETAGRAEGANR